MFSMEGKTVLVTGGGRGIGRAICILFARQGANVVINYAGNEAAALETKALCEAEGAKAKVKQADVSIMAESEALIQFAVSSFGNIDILVNNAGITKDGLMMRLSEADFDRVLDVNLKGSFHCMKQVSRLMMKQQSGRIINLTSVVGLCGNAGQTNYCASKAGVIGLTKAAAKEFAKKGITVNAVAPGFIESDMTSVLKEEIKQELLKSIPMERPGQTEEVANAVLFLASKEASYITGQVLSVNGGMYM